MADPLTSSHSDKDMGELRLYVWGSNLPSLPTLDPTCLYAASLLQHSFSLLRSDSNFQLKLVSAPLSTPTVPLLEVVHPSGEVQIKDGLDQIRQFCVAEAGLESAIEMLDGAASGSAERTSKAARATALHALLDDELLDITLHSLFSFPDNFRAVTYPAYASIGRNPSAKPASASLSSYLTLNPASSIPTRLRKVVEARLSNPAVALWGVGGREGAAQRREADDLSRKANILPKGKKGLDDQMKEKVRDEFERGKLVNKAKQTLDVLAAALGKDRWLLGSSAPTALDLHLYAYLDPLISCKPELPTSTIPTLLRQEYPTLIYHAEQVRQQLCPEGDRTMCPMWLSATEIHASHAALGASPPAQASSSSGWSWSSLLGFKPSDTSKASVPLSSSSSSAPAAGGGPSDNERSDLRAKRSSSGKPTLSREEKRLRLGRAIWICSALLGLVGFTFASGIVSVEWRDDEDEAEEEGQDEEDEVEEDDDDDDDDDDEGENEDGAAEFDEGDEDDEQGWRVAGPDAEDDEEDTEGDGIWNGDDDDDDDD